MRYYRPQEQYKYFCGIDLHTSTMYLCVLDEAGKIQLQKNIRSRPGAFLAAIEPFREGLVVACECVFCWFGPEPVRCSLTCAEARALSSCWVTRST